MTISCAQSRPQRTWQSRSLEFSPTSPEPLYSPVNIRPGSGARAAACGFAQGHPTRAGLPRKVRSCWHMRKVYHSLLVCNLNCCLVSKFRDLLKVGSRTLACTTSGVPLKHKIPVFPSAISQHGKEIPPTTYERSSSSPFFNGKKIKTLKL